MNKVLASSAHELPVAFDPATLYMPISDGKSIAEMVMAHSTAFPDRARLVNQLYQMLAEEFSYKGNTAPLKAWGYANSQLAADIETLNKLDGIPLKIKFISIFSNIKDLLTSELQREFSNVRTSSERKKEILNRLVNCPLNQVRRHNCYGIIIYAAALADIISGKGVHRLINEITAQAHARIGGGLIAHPGLDAPFCITHTISDITLDDIDELAAYTPQPGELIIFSVPGSGTHVDILDTNKFYAHVACVGREASIVHFWDIDENRSSDEMYKIKSLTLPSLLKIILRKHSPVTVRFVDPPWSKYKI